MRWALRLYLPECVPLWSDRSVLTLQGPAWGRESPHLASLVLHACGCRRLPGPDFAGWVTGLGPGLRLSGGSRVVTPQHSPGALPKCPEPLVYTWMEAWLWLWAGP